MIPIDVSAGVTGGFPTLKNIDQYPTGYRFSQTGLPEGLTINEATGVISGKPVAATASGGTAIITAYDFGAEFDQTVSEASITISYQRVLEESILRMTLHMISVLVMILRLHQILIPQHKLVLVSKKLI